MELEKLCELCYEVYVGKEEQLCDDCRSLMNEWGVKECSRCGWLFIGDSGKEDGNDELCYDCLGDYDCLDEEEDLVMKVVSMKEYRVFIDISETWEDDDIDTISIVVEGEDVLDAYNNLREKIEEGYYEEDIGSKEYYIWEIIEEYLLED